MSQERYRIVHEKIEKCDSRINDHIEHPEGHIIEISSQSFDREEIYKLLVAANASRYVDEKTASKICHILIV